MKQAFLTLLLSLLTLTLASCAQLGISSPTSFNENLAIGYTSVTTIRQTATSLLNAKKLTAEDGQNVLQQTDNARTGLDIARKLSGTDLSSATNKLTAIRSVLSSLSAYLTTKQSGGN